MKKLLVGYDCEKCFNLDDNFDLHIRPHHMLKCLIVKTLVSRKKILMMADST